VDVETSNVAKSRNVLNIGHLKCAISTFDLTVGITFDIVELYEKFSTQFIFPFSPDNFKRHEQINYNICNVRKRVKGKTV
jgi:hypothetical protein